MDQPDGTPKTRALSLTMIGRLPVEVEIAAVLQAPCIGQEKEQFIANIYRSESDTRMQIIIKQPERRERGIIFAKSDTLLWLTDYHFFYESIIVTGLEPGRIYGLKRIAESASKLPPAFTPEYLVPDETGGMKASEAGVVFLGRKK